MDKEMIDIDTIKRWWDIFVQSDNLVEVRILGKFQYSGYFKSLDNLIREISPYTQLDNEQIYYTLNEINADCYGRQQCEKMVKSPKTTTTDSDITRRKFVMIDFDPKRANGVNSSEQEFVLAYKKAQEVFVYLRKCGFSEPVVCVSGNGYHLQYKVDCLNNDENTEILKRFLQSLSNMFTDDYVDIDEKVFNAGRICKLYGTMAKKGANIPERPWRMSKIVYVPKEIKVNDISLFKSIADLLPKEEPRVLPNRGNYISNKQFDLVTWLNEHGVKYREKKSGNSTLYELEYCPWVETHSDKKKWDSALFVDNQGKITFNCTHSHCKDKTWHDVRLFYEPDAYDKPQRQQYTQRIYHPKPKYEIKDELPELGEKWLSMSKIKKIDLTNIEHVKTGFTELDKNIVGLNMSEMTILSGNNACVDCDTEYFNGAKWKKISDFIFGEKVLQYNIDGSAELVTPQRYIKSPCDELYLIQSITGVDQCVSLNHNLVYMTSKGNLAKKTMNDVIKMHNGTKNGFSGRFYTTFNYNGGSGIGLTDDEIRLMCAVICDGSFSGKYRNKNIVRINLKKDRKKERLENLLRKCGIEYRKEQYNPKDFGYNSYFFNAPRMEKEFSDEWYSCTSEQLAVIADEIMYWDGHIAKEKRKTSSYFSTSKKNIDFVQFAFASIGVRTHINVDNRVGKYHSGGKYQYKRVCYQLTICSTKNPSIINHKKKGKILKYRTKDGLKYCFTVPSGMLVLRRNGNINITGNSGKSSWLNTLIMNIVQNGLKVALWSGELRPDILKAWIQMVAAGKSNLRLSQYGDGKYYVPQMIGEKIDAWLDGKLYIYNNEYGAKWEQIFHDMNVLLTVGVKVFVLDNLFSLDIDLFDGDKNNKQKELVLQIKEFAKKNMIHIILVAHPRKSMSFLRKNDISGSADIQNAADNIFIIHRCNQDFFRCGEEFFGKAIINMYQGFGNVLEVSKNRMYGIVDLLVGFHYEVESRRFKNTLDEEIHYGWEERPEQQQVTFEMPKNNIDYYIDEDADRPF